jgi:hypothetical protein
VQLVALLLTRMGKEEGVPVRAQLP